MKTYIFFHDGEVWGYEEFDYFTPATGNDDWEATALYHLFKLHTVMRFIGGPMTFRYRWASASHLGHTLHWSRVEPPEELLAMVTVWGIELE